jgi:hypothetical protein
MSHMSRMMNMRFKAMQRNMEEFWIVQNELMEWEHTHQINETTARCETLTTFRMFDVSGMWASDYKVLSGY